MTDEVIGATSTLRFYELDGAAALIVPSDLSNKRRPNTAQRSHVKKNI